nr:PREDICTED: lipase maturation factor 1 isoform X3 [Latimeria chalumnae]|eukprot:XP_005993174.1 PREDICTED: lipase maturation factor 1 isoform X3 [Latimeria chalumnae]
MAASMEQLGREFKVEKTSLRKRGAGGADSLRENLASKAASEGEEKKEQSKAKGKSPSFHHLRGSYWLTRILLLRFIAFIYCVAFLVAYNQNKPLIGEKGLLPCKLYLKNVKHYFGGKINMDTLSYTPTILWFLDWSDMDVNLDYIAVTGLGLSAFTLITGCANMITMALLWILYHSLVNAGQIWYSFGWESQLLETGFLGIFLCPLWTLRAVPHYTPPSSIIIWALRWLIFRIMLGAGLIKIRGDHCWRDLTCMDYHYETQPIPNPLAYYMHRSPWWFHQFETLVNHFIELIVPFFVFMGRRMCITHGILQILFQMEVIEASLIFFTVAKVVLIISGNLSFLNWLTIVPSIACFDDASLGFLFSSREGGVKDQVSRLRKEEEAGLKLPTRYGTLIRHVLNVFLGLLIAYLSVPVILNLLSSRQVMNTSFNPLRIVNTYGAFGSITKERTEIIFQGTSSLDPNDPSALWEEYEFKCKPGDLKRRPCLITPYHYRLDWLMWFAAFQIFLHDVSFPTVFLPTSL